VTALLEVEDLHVAYGHVEAVRGVSLLLDTGNIVTVIGPNGAGKTTLLAALMGLLPSRGHVRFDGADLRRLDVEDRVERGISLVPEQRALFADMSVADNLLLGAYPHRRDRTGLRSRLGEVEKIFPRLAERRRQLAGTLSGGERQMLALGRALMSRPRLLLLDEPSLGLAPLITTQIFASLKKLNQDEGLSILLVEQNATKALALADRGIVLATGLVRLEGPARDLLAREEVRAAYLG